MPMLTLGNGLYLKKPWLRFRLSAEQIRCLPKCLAAQGFSCELRMVKRNLDLDQLVRLGRAAYQRGDVAGAERCYRQVLSAKRKHFDALHLLGVLRLQQGRPHEAERLFTEAIAVNGNFAPVFLNRGNALRDLQRPNEALRSYEAALKIKPDYAEALNNRGTTFLDLGDLQNALFHYDEALRVRADYWEALRNRGTTLAKLGRLNDALSSYESAIAIRPNYADALNDRGNVLALLQRTEDALMSFDAAIKAHPRHVEALSNRGNVLRTLNRSEEALESYERALAIRPDDVEALNHRGNALRDLNRLDDALASYSAALTLRPSYPDGLNNRGAAFLENKQYDEAARDFARLLKSEPTYDYAPGNLFHAQRHACNWTNFDEAVTGIVSDVNYGRRADTPFAFLSVSSSARLQLLCSKSYAGDRFREPPQTFDTLVRRTTDKIRIAYVSGDFREHPVAYLLVGLLERHDRRRFEVVGVFLRPGGSGVISMRVRAAFDQIVDVSDRTDAEVATLLREMRIDIAIDLMGFTQGSRTGIFARRAAMIQVNYLGYPGTMGAEYFDYIIADGFVIPSEQRANYAEKVVYLPDTFQANDSMRHISGNVHTRDKAGLPEDALVFCSFNNSYKITPKFFDIWMRLLTKVDGSVLWIVGEGGSIRANIRKTAADRGVNPERIVFAPRIEYAEHLARYRLADLFLDTLPFGAGATASDALWAGLPVLTCVGEAFASRMAGSLLHALGLAELVTESPDAYEAVALKLATAPVLLSEIKRKLADNRASYPLFDSDRFCRNIENAYVMMWERLQSGRQPESFEVSHVRRQ